MPPRKRRVPSPNKKQPNYYVVMGLETGKTAFPIAMMLFNVFLSLTAFVQYKVPDNHWLILGSLSWGIPLGCIYLAIKKAADPGPLFGTPSDNLLIGIMFAGLLMSSVGVGQFVNCTFDFNPPKQQVLPVVGKELVMGQEDVYYVNVRPEEGQWPLRRLRVSEEVYETVEAERSTVVLSVNQGLFGFQWMHETEGVLPVAVGQDQARAE